MKIKLFLLLIISSIISLAQPPKNYKLVWRDEFKGTSVDTSKWTVVDNFKRENTCYNKENVVVADGTMKLLVKKEENDCKAVCTGGLLNSKYRDDYFYIEAKLRYLSKGPGFWGNFWTCGWANGKTSWPPEFDIAELTANHPGKIYQCYHYRFEGMEKKREDSTWIDIDPTQYHVYGAERTADNKVNFYIDGKLTHACSVPAMDKMQFVIPRFGCFYDKRWGGLIDETTVFPGVAEYDYIRLYKHKNVIKKNRKS